MIVTTISIARMTKGDQNADGGDERHQHDVDVREELNWTWRDLFDVEEQRLDSPGSRRARPLMAT